MVTESISHPLQLFEQMPKIKTYDFEVTTPEKIENYSYLNQFNAETAFSIFVELGYRVRYLTG